MDSPAKKRTLEAGCTGKDVQAVQRALQRGLRAKGQLTVLAATGTFGDGTETDMVTWQRCNGIEGSGVMGQPTLDSLWPHMDAYAVSLYYRAKLGQPTKLPGPIKKGAHGDRVRAAQQAFWRMLGTESRNTRNGTFGDGLQDDIRLFAKRTDQDISTDQISQGTWDCVWSEMDDYARELAYRADKGSGGGAPSVRAELVTEAERYVSLGGSYTQKRPYDRGELRSPLYGDCSRSIHRLMQLAGAPDPSGAGFNGSGYTGTMQTRGSRIDLAGAPGNLLAGDCVFFGDQGGGVAQHVEMYLDSGRMFGFGATPPTIHAYTQYWPAGRRHDLGARRYFS